MCVACRNLQVEHFAPNRREFFFKAVERSLLRRLARSCAPYEVTALPQRIRIKRAILPALPRSRALQLPARCLRQRRRIQQYDCYRNLATRVEHAAVQLRHNVGRREALFHQRRDFECDRRTFGAIDIGGKCNNPAFAHELAARFNSLLDILRIQVLATYDDQIFATAGDIELPVMNETQVAGAQPTRRAVCTKRRCAGIGTLPITVRYAWAPYMDFPDLATDECLPTLRIDDLDHVARLRRAACDQHGARLTLRRDGHASGRQGVALKPGRYQTRAAPAARHEERCFGEAITRV